MFLNIQVRTIEFLELSSSTSKLSGQKLTRFIDLVKDPYVDVNSRDSKDGMNAFLKLSRHYGHDNLIQLVEPLIERGIDVNAKGPNSWSALHNLCRYYGHGNLVDLLLLLKNKSNLDIIAKNGDGDTAFDLVNFKNPADFSATEMSVFLRYFFKTQFPVTEKFSYRFNSN